MKRTVEVEQGVRGYAVKVNDQLHDVVKESSYYCTSMYEVLEVLRETFESEEEKSELPLKDLPLFSSAADALE